MSPPIINPQRSSRHQSYGDGCSYSLMLGFGETYFAAFAIWMGLGDVFAGLLSTVPLIFGGVLQLFGPSGIRFFKSVKKWVVFCALIQSLTHLPLAYAAYVGSITHAQLLFVIVIYWAAGQAGGPAWNYWIGHLLQRETLRGFFATRNLLNQLCALVAFMCAGYGLHHLDLEGHAAIGFMGLFIFASIFRLISTAFLSQHRECTSAITEFKRPPFKESLTGLRNLEGVWILGFLLVMQFGVSVASPFFSPYMLSSLQVSYVEYTYLIAGSFLGKILFSPIGSLVIKRIGTLSCLLIMSLFVSLAPQFWIYSKNLSYLFCLQVAAGSAWVTYELAATLLIFEKIEQKDRIWILTYYALIHSLCTVLGSTVGGMLLDFIGPSANSYAALFKTSSGLRGLATIGLCIFVVHGRTKDISWKKARLLKKD